MARPKFITDRDKLEKLAPMLKAPLKRQVFVCTGKSCSEVGGREVMAEFDRQLCARGLRQGKESKGRNPMGSILLTECSSIGFCSIGTAVMVHPDGTLYGQVQPEDVEEIVEEHLEKGKVVERLALMRLPNEPKSIDEFDSILRTLLDRHPYPPYDADGLMFVGPPVNDNVGSSAEKEWFVNLLCLLVAFNMTVYASYPRYYERIKTIFRIPTFEYGLTNTYYYPEELFTHFRIPFRWATFEPAFELYQSYVKEMLAKSNISLPLEEVHKLIAVDKDVNRGTWGRQYCDYLNHQCCIP